MKRFLLRLSLFGLLFFAFDKLFILIRNYSAQQEADKRLEQLLKGEINPDISIFGSSRGARNVIASQISADLGRSAFNFSYPGSDIEFHEYLLSLYLKHCRKKPEVVVLIVDDMSELAKSSTIKFRYDRLYPLVKYPEIRHTLIEKGEKNELLSDLFILHQLSRDNFDIRKKKFEAIDTLLSCGSMPISIQSKKFHTRYISEVKTYAIDKELDAKRNSFLKFIQTCKENNIRLVLAFPPNFWKPSKGFAARIRDLAGNNAHFMHYDTSRPEYTQADYYYDAGHLKINGAKIFTMEISNFIKTQLLQPGGISGKQPARKAAGNAGT